MKRPYNTKEILIQVEKACSKIAPLWPLDSFVAVNPYLGLSDKSFESAALHLAQLGGINTTLPLPFYLQKIEEGIISLSDLQEALNRRSILKSPLDFLASISKKDSEESLKIKSITLSDLAEELSNKNWNRLKTARISSWAASHFDAGQAHWNLKFKNQGLFKAWKREAEIDRTPEINGLKNFRKLIEAFPDNSLEVILHSLNILEIESEDLSNYFYRLLLSMSGWAAHTARLDFESKLRGEKGTNQLEFLAILVSWDVCLMKSLNSSKLNQLWNRFKQSINDNSEEKIPQTLLHKLILQEAFDLSSQRKIAEKFNAKPQSASKADEIIAQAVFCIDVRSEVYRRNLEAVDSKIETLGFAGFFGFPINYIPLGEEKGQTQCPVLLNTGPSILEKIPETEKHKESLKNKRFQSQVKAVWKSFKTSSVSSFGFVSPIGLSYLPKLFSDSFAWSKPTETITKALSKHETKNTISLQEEDYHGISTGIPLDQQVQMAKNVLTAMSLKSGFAPFVLLVGHGSTMVNNPHAAGYDCGACGGHSGESNAKVAAAVLNNKLVRMALQKEQIIIPEQTLFLACLHDTTRDEISIFNEDEVTASQKIKFESLKESLLMASLQARIERSVKMNINPEFNIEKQIFQRSKDWSQIRPEWGLAGCSSFIIAPRERTKDLNLGGGSFLHSYNWSQDENFSVLELIMTAPMVVTSWINLQYFGSSVDNNHLGSGNKTLHNITAGIGVLEGHSGDLRVGLPLQAIHDGTKLQHEPLRLNIVIEAPIEAINSILQKHKNIKQLFDNEWLFLHVIDESGKIAHRYNSNLNWQSLSEMAA